MGLSPKSWGLLGSKGVTVRSKLSGTAPRGQYDPSSKDSMRSSTHPISSTPTEKSALQEKVGMSAKDSTTEQRKRHEQCSMSSRRCHRRPWQMKNVSAGVHEGLCFPQDGQPLGIQLEVRIHTLLPARAPFALPLRCHRQRYKRAQISPHFFFFCLRRKHERGYPACSGDGAGTCPMPGSGSLCRSCDAPRRGT